MGLGAGRNADRVSPDPMTFKAAQKHLFYQEIAKLLGAGFGIRQAAAVLLDTKLPPVQERLLRNLNCGLEAGQTITQAFSSDTHAVSELERSMISAGERGGDLAPAFQHLSDYFGMVASARRALVGALIYPLVILHLGIFVATVPTAMMKGDKTISEIFGHFSLILLVTYCVVFIAFLGVRAVLAMGPRRTAVDRMLSRVPILGKARQDIAMARFCKVYHACLLSGISMVETVRVASSAAHSALIRDGGKSLEIAARSGNSLGSTFIAERGFPKSFSMSYLTGEEAGTLDKDLERWAKFFQNEAEAGAKRLSIVVPKLLYFFILAFVAWKMIGFFSGYNTMIESIDRD